MSVAKEDKIAFWVIVILFCGFSFLSMWGVREFGEFLLGWFSDRSDGVGYRVAFIISVLISIMLISVFAVISGGGDLIGEIPFVLMGFFVLVIFFTVSVAWLF